MVQHLLYLQNRIKLHHILGVFKHKWKYIQAQSLIENKQIWRFASEKKYIRENKKARQATIERVSIKLRVQVTQFILWYMVNRGYIHSGLPPSFMCVFYTLQNYGLQALHNVSSNYKEQVQLFLKHSCLTEELSLIERLVIFSVLCLNKATYVV